MAYQVTSKKSGKTYFLHSKTVPLKNTKKPGTVTLYYFANEVKAGALDALPDGKEVAETPSGLPVLKSKK